MLNVREALLRFKGLPVKIFAAGPNYDLAKELIFKTKINI